MKKLKSIFCMAFVLAIACLSLVGCGGDNNTTATVTLQEAKTVILNALKIDKSQTNLVASSETLKLDNRDLLEKFGKISINLSGSEEDYLIANPSKKQIIKQTRYGTLEYSNGNFVKYSVEESRTLELNLIDREPYDIGTKKEYFADNKMYKYNSSATPTITERRIENQEDINKVGYENSIGSGYAKFLKELFSENTFSCYPENISKTTINDGFYYSFDLNVKKLEYLTYRDYIRENNYPDVTDEEFETIWQNEYKEEYEEMAMDPWYSIKITINFDANKQITNVILDYNGEIDDIGTGVYMDKTIGKVTIAKYDGQVTEPQWVTDYKAN